MKGMAKMQTELHERIERRKRFIVNFAYFIILFGLSVLLVRYALPALLPFVIALLVALLLKPLVNFFQNKCHLNRNVTAVILVLLFYGTIGLIAVLLVIELIQYLGSIVSKLPAFYSQTIVPALYSAIDGIENLINSIDADGTISLDGSIEQIVASLGTAITNFSGTILGKVGNFAVSVPSMLLNVIITIISSAFLLMDFEVIRNFLRLQISEKKSETIRTVTSHLGKVLRRYILSYALIMIITFTEIWLGLLIIGIKNATAIALLIAVFDILPVVGSGMVMMPWSVITLLSGNIGQGIGLLILWAFVIVVRNIIEPKIVGQSVGMHPLLTLFAMIAGNFIYGGVGILLLPVTLALCQSLNGAGIIHLYTPTPAHEETRGGKITRAVNGFFERIGDAVFGFFKRLFTPGKKKNANGAKPAGKSAKKGGKPENGGGSAPDDERKP